MNQPFRRKKLKETTGVHDSHHSAPSSPITWYYNPVDINWQQERSNSLGLQVCDSDNTYVTFKESRYILRTAPFTRTHYTRGDGNCFFRAISMYLTGNDDSHIQLRTMITDHMVRNKDKFLVLTKMVGRPKDFDNYIHLKKSSFRRRKSNWANENIIMATSSLLKTPIVCYAPEDGIDRNVWCTIDGVTFLDGAIYDDRFGHFNYTEKQIVLNNLSDHFEPADFE